MNLQLSDNQKGRYKINMVIIITFKNDLSPLNSQAYLMKEAVKYGKS